MSLHCMSCNYDLRGLSPARNCPECGTPISQSLSAPRPASPLATLSLVLAIFSACFFPLGPVVLILFIPTRRQLASGRYGTIDLIHARAALIMACISSAILFGFMVMSFFN